MLDKVEFHGELRSLAGPVKGDGSFVVAGQHYPYRVSTSRVADDGGVKVRLAVEPVDAPLTAEADLTISIERGTPRFEGGIQVTRAVGRAPAGAPSLIIDSWRVTSRVKGDGTAALLDQIELQYGPDDRAIKLKGKANLTFGRRPEVNGVLSSPQIDLDRVLGLPEATRRRPLEAIKTLAESFIAASRLPDPHDAEHRCRERHARRCNARARRRRCEDRRRRRGHPAAGIARAGGHPGAGQRAASQRSDRHAVRGNDQDRGR